MRIEISDFRTFAMANMMKVESILAEIYTAHCQGRTGFAMFDGGAHRAYHTLRMLDLPGCERVFAVEADPFMAEVLRKNLGEQLTQDGSRITLIEAALQGDPATTSIPWKSSPSHVGRSSIVSGNPERNTIWGDNPDMEYREEMSVAATTIDIIVQNEMRELPFLKLDLEGADLLALRGASHTLEHKRPIVAFENSIHAPKVHGFTLEQMAAYFDGLGFQPMNFVGEPIGPDDWFGFFEAWAVPKEHVDWMSRTVQEAVQRQMSTV